MRKKGVKGGFWFLWWGCKEWNERKGKGVFLFWLWETEKGDSDCLSGFVMWSG